ncbi:helix-turn-helix domain-containing protein [Nocardia sp. CA-135398]|uniref:helix-turn-helix domain-containing protein n=1 Tax=Nocardia sp. CA-135398 TaxID=3239977 RepID=UPI003D96F9D9
MPTLHEPDGNQPEYSASTAGHVAHPGRPLAPRLILGGQLRRLREHRGLEINTAAQATGISRFKLSRIELGKVPTKQDDLTKLFTYYQLTDDQVRSTLRELAHQANLPGWWELTSTWLPEGLDRLLSLEPVAWRILCYEQRLIPELLQTEEYSRAALRMAYPDRPFAELEQLVALHQRRKERLVQSTWPRAWFLVEAAAMRARIGGDDVWRRQLDHLIELSRLHAISLQVVREEAIGPAQLDHGFTYLVYTDGDLSDTVSFQRLNCFEYEQNEKQTRRYFEQFHRLAVYAELPGDKKGDTTDVIQTLRDCRPLRPVRSHKFQSEAASGPEAPPPPGHP